MANEIIIGHPTGNTLYLLVFNTTGQAWNGTAFEDILLANWSDYVISMNEAAGTGIYLGSVPAIEAGAYSFMVRLQAGASPAGSDTSVAGGSLVWDGTAVAVPGLGSIPVDVVAWNGAPLPPISRISCWHKDP